MCEALKPIPVWDIQTLYTEKRNKRTLWYIPLETRLYVSWSVLTYYGVRLNTFSCSSWLSYQDIQGPKPSAPFIILVITFRLSDVIKPLPSLHEWCLRDLILVLIWWHVGLFLKIIPKKWFYPVLIQSYPSQNYIGIQCTFVVWICTLSRTLYSLVNPTLHFALEPRSLGIKYFRRFSSF